MCPECGQAYYAHMIKEQPFGRTLEWYCPNYDCDGTVLFTIDELMIPAVQKLNRLGYRTEFCCSGHNRNMRLPKDYGTIDPPDKLAEYGYIKFHHRHIPETCPVGWIFDDQYIGVIRSRCDSLAWSIQNLEDWVATLKPHK